MHPNEKKKGSEKKIIQNQKRKIQKKIEKKIRAALPPRCPARARIRRRWPRPPRRGVEVRRAEGAAGGRRRETREGGLTELPEGAHEVGRRRRARGGELAARGGLTELPEGAQEV